MTLVLRMRIHVTTPNAESSGLFGNRKMSFIRAPKVRTNSLGQLLGGKQAILLDHIAFGMNPLRLNRIEPGTFGRQKKGQNTHPFALLLDLLVVLSDPGLHQLAHVKGGIIPNQQPVGLALHLQLGATPLQKLGGESTHRATINKAQRHVTAERITGRSLLPKDSITGESLWVGIILLPDLLHQTNRMIFTLPRLHQRQCEPAPPDLIQKPDGPARLRACPGDQAIARRFFLKYRGSGLVIQCLARFQLIPNFLSVWRMVSELTSRFVQPCLTHSLATRESVHRLVSNPKSRGGRCNRALKASASTPSRAVRKCRGRLEPACRASRPFWLKAWIALRTVCWSQLRDLAMLGTRSPRKLASRIWLRRNTKAFEERKAASSCLYSSSVSGRTKIGCFMRSIIPHSRSPFLRMH